MIALDQTISATISNNSGSVTTASFSTTTGNQLLLAFVACNGSANPGIASVTGAGINWSSRVSTNSTNGTAAIYSAYAPSILSSQTVSATSSGANNDMLLTVVSFTGADPTGTNGSGAIGATKTSTFSTSVPTLTITSTRANSLMVACGTDETNNNTITAGTNQTVTKSYLDGTDFVTMWCQRQIIYTSKVGTVITMNDTAPSGDTGAFVALEVLPATPSVQLNKLRPHAFSPGVARPGTYGGHA